MIARSLPTNAKVLLLGWLLLVLLVLIAASLVFPVAIYLVLGLGALVLVVAPVLFQQRVDWFSPWSLVILTVFLGCTCESLCVAADWPNPDKIYAFFTLGRPPADFLRPGAVMLAGLGAMAVGYFVGRRAPDPGRSVKPCTANPLRLYLLLFLIFVAALVSSYLYIIKTGGLNSGILSGKRTTIFDIDIQGDETFNQFGPLRQIAELAGAGYLLFLAYCLTPPRKFSPAKLVVLICLFLVAVIVPFYSSTRGTIVWLFISTAAIIWYTGGRAVKQRLAVLGIACLALLMFMSLIREKRDVAYSFDEKIGLSEFADHVVMTSIYAGLCKTTQIIYAVPDPLAYQYGKTIAVWLAAPIPRSIWAGKPLIQSGPIIGVYVFGTRVSGIPPGMIAELYWNFSLPGVLAGSWLMGVLLRWLTRRYEPVPGNASLEVLVYVAGPMRLGYDLLSHSVGFAIFSMLINMTIALTLVFLVRDRSPRVNPIRLVHARGAGGRTATVGASQHASLVSAGGPPKRAQRFDSSSVAGTALLSRRGNR